MPVKRLAARAADGERLPVWGGFARSTDAGETWQVLRPEGLPAGAQLWALAAFGDVVLVAAAPGSLYRAIGDGPFQQATVGGPRRLIYSIGASADRMLASGADGTVYQSVDDGQTWSAVVGGPPKVDKPTQLPSAPVRCVLETEERLYAGTDAGLYLYDGADWSPTSLTLPVFDLLEGETTLYAATPEGIHYSEEEGLWPIVSGASGRVYALAQLENTIYAGTDDGICAFASGETSIVQIGQPVTSLLVVGDTLLAGTVAGIYRTPAFPPPQTLECERCDRSHAFTFPQRAIDPVPTKRQTPPGTLVEAFAAYGIVLGQGAMLEPSPGAGPSGLKLTDGADTYLIAHPKLEPNETWQVWACDLMPRVNALATPNAKGDTALAIGGTLEALATEWPTPASTSERDRSP
jgi:hypothetical protein